MYQKIKELCTERGISVATMESEVGFANGTVRRWGAIQPSIDKVIKVADYLGVSVDELCGRGITSTPLTESFLHELQHDLSEDENMIIQRFRTLSDADKVKLLFTIMKFEKGEAK